jgi:hypothetical protein
MSAWLIASAMRESKTVWVSEIIATVVAWVEQLSVATAFMK